MIDLSKLTIKNTLKHLQDGDFSARELVESYLSRITSLNKEINAYLEVYDDVLKQADEVDEKIRKGDKSPLLGVPIAIKDNILIKGKKANSSSKILEGYVSQYDDTVIKKLKDAGAIFLGRANMDEFAMGSSTENSAFGVTKNPLDTTRVAGGSSGGSVASVAMDGALGALGSDTGGSVREPASFCGVVGLKPTYGGVSRYGLMALGSSLDVIGPITKTATDSEILFNVIKGIDPMDSTTFGEDVFPKVDIKKKMTLGVPYHILNKGGMTKEAREIFDNSIEKLKNLGFEIKEIQLPNIEYSLAVYYIIMPAEASSNLARFDGVRFGLHVEGKDLLDDYMKTKGIGFGKEARRRILIGTYVLSAGYHDAYYNKALKLRSKISRDFTNAFSEVDAIITPTTTGPAFKIGEKANDPLALYLEDIFTVPANIVGIPAISIPSGKISVENKEMPLGLQIMSKHGAEDVLFYISKKFLGE